MRWIVVVMALAGCAQPVQQQAYNPVVSPASAPALPIAMSPRQQRDAAMLREIAGSSNGLGVVTRYAAENVRTGIAPIRREPDEVTRLLGIWTSDRRSREASTDEARRLAADERYCRGLAADVSSAGLPPLEAAAHQVLGVPRPYEGAAFNNCMASFSRTRAWMSAQ